MTCTVGVQHREYVGRVFGLHVVLVCQRRTHAAQVLLELLRLHRAQQTGRLYRLQPASDIAEAEVEAEVEAEAETKKMV